MLPLLLILGLLIGVASAQNDTLAPLDPLKAAEWQNASQHVLQEAKAALERKREEVRTRSAEMPAKLKELESNPVSEAVVEQARLDTNSIRLRQDDLRADIASVEQHIKELEQSIQNLEARRQLLQTPIKDATQEAERTEQLKLASQTLEQQRTELGLEKQHLETSQAYLELVTQNLALAEQWQTQVEELYRVQQEQNRREAREDLVKRLQQENQGNLSRLTELRQRLEEGDNLSEAGRLWLKTNIQSVEEKVALVQLNIRLATAEEDLAHLESLVSQADAEPKTLQSGLEQLSKLQGGLNKDNALLQSKVELYGKSKQIISRRENLNGSDKRLQAEELKLVDALLNDLAQWQNRVRQQLTRADAIKTRLEAYYKERASKDLLAREPLPVNADEAQHLLAAVIEAPALLFSQVRLSIEAAGKKLATANPLRWVSLVALELGLFWLVVVVRRRLVVLMDHAKAREDDSFLGQTVFNLLWLLRRNLLGIGCTAAVWLLLKLAQIPRPGLGIVMTVLLLGVGVKLLINLAWLLLSAPQLPPAQRQPQLYWQVALILVGGGLLTGLTILAQLAALTKPVSGVFDRVFMGFWLLAFPSLLRIRHLLIAPLAERYAGRFWFSGLRLANLVLPLSLAGAALVGLLGYLNLAWTIAWHLLVLVIVLASWLVVRGLLHDLSAWLKNYAVTHSNYGLLWTQDIINPLQKILDIALFVGAWAALFRAYGWRRESTLVAAIWSSLDFPLFTLGGTDITTWRIVVTGLTVVVVMWLGQWGRSVTYRWVFSRIADLGVRHSLSVFTQYAIVLIGFLITLRSIGLDLTTLTVFAGALGVGLGFGMQNIANNFISGLLLLIERPLRSGDIVKIAENEGEITRIGIRSLSMRTWDNQEVIIPNSEVITNAFTNWTHQDKIIRTVLMIGASYDADPHKVREILEKALRSHKEVLTEPKWAALLWEFGDSAVVFRVHYHVDLSKSNMLGVRNEIMFAIWDGLKQAGVGIPYPQRDLYIKEWPADKFADQPRKDATVMDAPPVSRMS